MRKKYLSALLFGALLVTSAGTFTSCKDYDDDINNLQEQITANADAIKKLQELIGDGKFVTGVTAENNGLKITWNDGQSTVIENVINGEAQQGDVVTINAETGEIVINGEGTGFFATKGEGEIKLPYVNDEGVLVLVDAEGKEVVTGIRVAPVTAVVNEDGSAVLTIIAADGTKQTVNIPSAASVMRDLELMGWIDYEDITTDGKLSLEGVNKKVVDEEVTSDLTIKYRYISNFSIKDEVQVGGKSEDAPTSWSAQKEVTKKQVLTTLAANKTQLVARVAPADLDLSSFEFTLQDSKGNILPVGLNKSEKFNGVLTRATESSINLIPLDVTSDTYESENDYTKLIPLDGRVYSLVTGTNNRSTYGEFAIYSDKYADADLKDVKVIATNPEGTVIDGTANDEDGSKDHPFVVDLNTPTIFVYEIPEQVYDYYVVPADETAAKEFGFSTDKKNGTITLTKSIDLVTKTGLELYVYSLRIDGTVYKQSVWVKPSSIMASAVTLKAGEQIIAPIFDKDGKIEATLADRTIFTVSLDEMFSKMSDTDKERWMSAVTGANADDPITVSNIKENGTAITKLDNKVEISFIDKDGKPCDNTKAAGLMIMVDYKDGAAGSETANLTPYKEYSMTVSFIHDEENNGTSVLNTVGLTVTPTLPKLSDYMTKRAAYWDGNVQMAYFDDPTNTQVDAGTILESKYNMNYGFTKLGWFDKATTPNCILDIDFSLDADQKIGDDKVVDKMAPITNAGDCINTITLGTVGTIGQKPFGYGQELNVKVNATYLDVYSYSAYDVTKAQLADAAYKINVRSALEAGTIAPADGTSITLTPSGASQMMKITAKDIKATAYNLDSPYNVFKDVQRDNKAVWGYNYIKAVTFATPDELLYQVVDEDGDAGKSAAAIDPTFGENAVESYVSLKGRNTTDGTETTITVTVTDLYGYTKVVDLPIVIKKANTGE